MKSKKKFIYVMQSRAGTLKIGVAANVQSRQKQLQTGNSDAIKIVKVFGPFNSANKLESLIHESLKESSLSGEWFSVSAPIACEAIDRELAKFIDGPDAVEDKTSVLDDMRFLFGENFDKSIFGLAMSNRLHLLNK